MESMLLNLLACPDCRSPLTSILRCHSCGISFEQATPISLFPQKANRTVSFQFTPNRSVSGDHFLKVFKYPSRCGAAGAESPYHLDLAHIDIIDQLPSGARILEIGCGGGQMRQWIRDKGYEYIGTDISTSRVQDSLKIHGGPDVLCDAHFLPFRDGVFDLVYSSAVTEHLACPYLVAQEVVRVLNPGGYYLGNVSFLEPWHDNSYFHMTPLGVWENLTQAGFESRNIWPGRDYTGFRAVLAMGNKATKFITFVGDGVHMLYRNANKLRNLARQRPRWSTETITDSARVAGAIDWIAQKPI
ncbi:Methyltransferase domain-containing protein [Rhodovastum atsumiense]|nr:Methyltransferase domain-containing protein [Rhodovastum atsumiense]